VLYIFFAVIASASKAVLKDISEQFGAARNMHELYQRQLRKLKDLKLAGAEKSELSEASKYLLSIKRSLRSQRKGSHESDTVMADKLYPPPTQLPTDGDGFVVSFHKDVLDDEISKREVVAFFDKYGFVVFRDVLTPEDCEGTASEILDQLESQYMLFRRGEIDTYSALSSETYGLAKEPAIFTPHIIKNRCNEYVVKALRLLLKDEDILLSHDRWCFYRPTKIMRSSGEEQNIPEWKTRSSLHLDLNPWFYMQCDTSSSQHVLKYQSLRDFSKEMNSVTHQNAPHLQGVLSITDNRMNDGGTVVVPGFHSVFTEWVKSLGSMREYMKHNNLRTNRLVWRGHGAGSFKFAEEDRIHSLKRRVTLRAGSFLVWDQRIVHGSMPNSSTNTRIVQFVKAFRRYGVPNQQLDARSKCIQRHMKEAGTLNLDITTDDVQRVLGLK